MTWLSRFSLGVSWGRHKKHTCTSGISLNHALWHVLCISVLCQGCLYLKPIEMEGNMPPTILDFNGDYYCDVEDYPDIEGNLICLGDFEVVVYVVANDPDGDVLSFSWVGYGSGPIGTADILYEGENQTSFISLTRDQVLDGEELRCTISDGYEYNSVGWTVVLL